MNAFGGPEEAERLRRLHYPRCDKRYPTDPPTSCQLPRGHTGPHDNGWQKPVDEPSPLD